MLSTTARALSTTVESYLSRKRVIMGGKSSKKSSSKNGPPILDCNFNIQLIAEVPTSGEIESFWLKVQDPQVLQMNYGDGKMN